jgi:hypothetical protein
MRFTVVPASQRYQLFPGLSTLPQPSGEIYREHMVPFGFDQTNGKADGLHGDDGGALPGPEQPTVAGFMSSVLRSPVLTDSGDPDPAVTSYSEERG